MPPPPLPLAQCLELNGWQEHFRLPTTVVSIYYASNAPIQHDEAQSKSDILLEILLFSK